MVDDVSDTKYQTFDIRFSVQRDDVNQPISADIAICPDCERDLFDPRNRHYLYPFTNCTHCGPRFTISKDTPYDRQNSSLAEFEMCERCRLNTMIQPIGVFMHSLLPARTVVHLWRSRSPLTLYQFLFEDFEHRMPNRQF